MSFLIEAQRTGVLDALEKFAAFTPAFLRTVARDSDVDPNAPDFKEKCRGLTGEAHLDKMSSGQLGQVAKMIWSKEASARKEPKPAKAKAPAKTKAPEKTKPKPKKEKPDDALTVMGKGLAGAATPIVANTAAMALATEAPRTGKADYSTDKNFRSLERDMGQSGTKKIEGPYAGMGEISSQAANETSPIPKAPPPSGSAAPKKPAAPPKADWGVVLPKGTSEATAAHELGHRANWKAIDGLVGKPASRGLFRGALMSQSLTGLTSMPLSAYAATDPEMSWVPGAAQLGVSSPRLLDEAAASLHALKHLIGKYGVGKGLRESARLAPAFGTYAAIAGAPLAITGARRAWNHYNKDPA